MLKIKNIKRFNPNGVFTGESTSTINFDSTLASESTSSSQETNPLFDNLANTLNEYTHSNTNSTFLEDFFKYYTLKNKIDSSGNEINASNDIVTALGTK